MWYYDIVDEKWRVAEIPCLSMDEGEEKERGRKKT